MNKFSNIEIVQVNCPYCHSAYLKCLAEELVDVENHVPGKYSISRCCECQFIFLSVRPDEESLSRCYVNQYYTQLEKRHAFLANLLFRLRFKFRLSRLNLVLNKIPTSVLEIGYGDGKFLGFLKKEWGELCKFIGIDFQRPQLGVSNTEDITFIEGDFTKINIDQTFDIILMYDVLEHIPNPLNTLKKLSKKLNPEGLLIGQVPNWESTWRKAFPKHWSGLQIPRHQSFFEPKSIEKILNSCGLKLTSLKKVFDPGDLSVSVCNWIVDHLSLKTPPRKVWFYFPMALLCAPFVLGQVFLFGSSGEIEFVAKNEQ